jgi:hypothetical protein
MSIGRIDSTEEDLVDRNILGAMLVYFKSIWIQLFARTRKESCFI